MTTAEYVVMGVIIGFALMALIGAFYDDLEEKNRASERRRQQCKARALTDSALAEASAQAANLNAVALRAATALLDEAIRASVVDNTATSGASTNRAGTPADRPSRRSD